MLYSKPTGDYKYLVEFSGNIIRAYTETYLSNYIDDFDAAAADADDNIGKQGQFPLTFLGIFVSVSRVGGRLGVWKIAGLFVTMTVIWRTWIPLIWTSTFKSTKMVIDSGLTMVLRKRNASGILVAHVLVAQKNHVTSVKIV